MCLRPVTIQKAIDDHRGQFEAVEVWCRKCWQCRDAHVSDWAGRLMAEASKCPQTLAVTLTYRGNVANAATLVYKDVQNFLKKLRRDVGKVRYLVAGEYGSLKGRAHWHLILFNYGKPLKTCKPGLPAPEGEIPLDTEQFDWPLWRHGYSFFSRPHLADMRYCVKYALKNWADGAASRSVMMSKKPPLGDAFFRDLLQQCLEADIPPSPGYIVPGVRDKRGRVPSFHMKGRSWTLFLERMAEAYGVDLSDPEAFEPFSRPRFEAVAEHLEKLQDRAISNRSPVTIGDSNRPWSAEASRAEMRKHVVAYHAPYPDTLDEDGRVLWEGLALRCRSFQDGLNIWLWSDGLVWLYETDREREEQARPWVVTWEGIDQWLSVLAAKTGRKNHLEEWLQVVRGELRPPMKPHGCTLTLPWQQQPSLLRVEWLAG